MKALRYATSRHRTFHSLIHSVHDRGAFSPRSGQRRSGSSAGSAPDAADGIGMAHASSARGVGDEQYKTIGRNEITIVLCPINNFRFDKLSLLS
ncbi:hypothetical protein EVAR_22518_1 [Eumeta japonica]|uniref:Uncharacterized protein n=1 Tax=Eumeta variegata TaxID=151549 RepID=A0A4C1U781_EUMVA|nr:hypothetical protein EVAR_22518_1 [Eumeta japonica]